MIILNFSHPLTADVLEALAESPHADQRVQEQKIIRCQADNEAPFGPQAVALADAVNWTGPQWQGNPFALVLPGLAPLAAALLAEIHGRSGYFPVIVRLKPVQGAVPVRFAFAETISLQTQREIARERR